MTLMLAAGEISFEAGTLEISPEESAEATKSTTENAGAFLADNTRAWSLGVDSRFADVKALWCRIRAGCLEKAALHVDVVNVHNFASVFRFDKMPLVVD